MRNDLKGRNECHHELIIALFSSQGDSMFKAVLKMNRDGGKGSKKETGMWSECEINSGVWAPFRYDILLVIV